MRQWIHRVSETFLDIIDRNLGSSSDFDNFWQESEAQLAIKRPFKFSPSQASASALPGEMAQVKYYIFGPTAKL